MKIAIIDADLIGRSNHRFPNLALLKLSAYNKTIGNNVTLIIDYRNLFSTYIELKNNCEPDFQILMFDDTAKKGYTRYYQEKNIIYDKIIISKVFTDTLVPLQILSLDITEYNGTGIFYDKATPLPNEIEHHMPDYHLYDEWVNMMINKGFKKNQFEYYLDYSIGFTTRGCFRQCSFCVNKNCTKVEYHSPIEEFLDKDRKYICLLDDNILGYGQWEGILNSLIVTKKPFQYKQGMDIRLMTKEKADILSHSNYKGDFIFAFDNIEDKDEIIEKIKLWKESYTAKGNTKFYVFCGFDRNDVYDLTFWKQDIVDAFERIKILMTYGCIPYIMRYKNYINSPFRGMYINIARWGNQASFVKKQSIKEFIYITDGEGQEDKNYASKRYLEDFKRQYPKIAEKYYGLKFEKLNIYQNRNIK